MSLLEFSCKNQVFERLFLAKKQSSFYIVFPQKKVFVSIPIDKHS